jgi:hypothetical protein
MDNKNPITPPITNPATKISMMDVELLERRAKTNATRKPSNPPMKKPEDLMPEKILRYPQKQATNPPIINKARISNVT